VRRGLQYECTGCAACIDGCNQVMDKLGYARGLIRYSSENALKADPHGDVRTRVVRPRVAIYGALLTVICAAFVTGLYLRSPLKVDVIRDRGTIMRETREGLVENVYRLQIMNIDEKPHRFAITASGIEGISVVAKQPVEIAAAHGEAVPIALRVDPARAGAGSHPITISVQDIDRPDVRADERSRFIIR
jgi:polyferredoxin